MGSDAAFDLFQDVVVKKEDEITDLTHDTDSDRGDLIFNRSKAASVKVSEKGVYEYMWNAIHHVQ